MRTAFRRMRPLLGTYVEIGTLVESGEESTSVDDIFHRAFEVIAKIQKLMSFHDPHSDLSRLNYAQGNTITLHAESVRVLRLSKALSKASEGLFNPTVGVQLQRLQILPDHADFYGVSAPCCLSGDADDIVIQGRQVSLKKPFCLVLDGIAKGYAIDRAIEVLRAQGLKNAWVNAGGDLRVFGDVVMPLQIRTDSLVSESLGGIQNCAVATTVIRENLSLDFKGYVVSGSLRKPQRGTWTVMASKAWRADGLTKVASLCGDDERELLMQKLGGRCL